MQENNNDKNMLPIGTKLHNGTLTIVRQLSSGGFGNTYEALNSFGIHVAVKEFFLRDLTVRSGDRTTISVTNSDNIAIFEEQKNKFYREALRLYHLRHPNIIRVYDRFEENGTAYYVMDYIAKGSLSDRLKKEQQPFSSEEVFRILDTLLSALEYLHKEDMLHLDIKPANIMITEKGELVLIDFGASKTFMSNELTKISLSHSTLAYTPGYAPVEQITQSSKFIGAWTDLYALGATMYKLLTNAKEIPDNMEITAHGKDAFSFSETVDLRLQELIVWLMSPYYSLRPQNVSEVREFLKKKGFEANKKQANSTAGVTEKNARREAKEETRRKEEETIVCSHKVSGADNKVAAHYDKKEHPSKVKKWLYRIGIGVVSIVVVFILLCFFIGNNSEIVSPVYEAVPQDTLSVVPDTLETPIKIQIGSLGEVDYVGAVDANNKAEGLGFASLPIGVYIGEFKDGNMEGRALYIFTKGVKCVFEGTFKNNSFEKGMLYDPETNKTFKGEFTADGQPNLRKGKWFTGNSISSKGKVIYNNAPRELTQLKKYIQTQYPNGFFN